MKMRTPNSCCTNNTDFFKHFKGFLRFVVWLISLYFCGVNQKHYCAAEGTFLVSFVYVMYLNIASYLY